MPLAMIYGRGIMFCSCPFIHPSVNICFVQCDIFIRLLTSVLCSAISLISEGISMKPQTFTWVVKTADKIFMIRGQGHFLIIVCILYYYNSYSSAVYKCVHATVVEAYIWWCSVGSHLFGFEFFQLLLSNYCIHRLCHCFAVCSFCTTAVPITVSHSNNAINAVLFVMLVFRYCSLVRVAK